MVDQLELILEPQVLEHQISTILQIKTCALTDARDAQGHGERKAYRRLLGKNTIQKTCSNFDMYIYILCIYIYITICNSIDHVHMYEYVYMLYL